MKDIDKVLGELHREMDRRVDHTGDCELLKTRLSCSFSVIHDCFLQLYPEKDFHKWIFKVLTILRNGFQERSRSLVKKDIEREKNPNWFLSQKWVGYQCYADRFAGDLGKMQQRIDYLEKLGVNLVHMMPLMVTPGRKNDGGYAVSNYCQVDPRLGKNRDLLRLAKRMRKKDMLLMLDLVINHSSDQHLWARKAQQGNEKYQEYYYTYPDREIPDQFESAMPEIFPTTDPRNFTFNEEMGRWVMTVFHRFQWDLNFQNPQVVLEMLKAIIFLANVGTDIIRLDAVPYLWKLPGTSCQNLPETHSIIRLLKALINVTAPGVLFLGEAIVSPDEVVKYLGSESKDSRECDFAYNATFMALLWDALATRNTDLMRFAISKLPAKPQETTWINYARCHDDIGLGFPNEDISEVGYDPISHRKFLYKFYSGNYNGSFARGALFMQSDLNGDARISGTLASLAGLEKAQISGNKTELELALARITMLHAVILSYGGIPVIYSGDELGMTNDHSYEKDPEKKNDNRWMHRPIIRKKNLKQIKKGKSVEARLFKSLKRLIKIRKGLGAFADHNNTQLLNTSSEHLLAILRAHATQPVLIIANFSEHQIPVKVDFIPSKGSYTFNHDFIRRKKYDPEQILKLKPYQVCWLGAR